MSTFGVQPTTGINDRTGALNYALNNIGQGFIVDRASGRVLAPNTNPTANNIWAYAYPIIQVAFADDALGTNISAYPTNKQYFGIKNTDVAYAGFLWTPTDYIWYNSDDIGLSGGFSTDKGLFYRVIGPHTIVWQGNFLSPAPEYFYPANDGNWVAINLDIGSTTANTIAITTITNYQVGNNQYNFYPTLAVPPGLPIYTDLTYDPNYRYQTSSTQSLNTLIIPNANIGITLTLDPQSAAPTVYNTGTIAMADAVSWDPATYSTTTPYLALYNGTTWVALG